MQGRGQQGTGRRCLCRPWREQRGRHHTCRSREAWKGGRGMGAWKKSKLLVTGVVAMGALICWIWLTAPSGETMEGMLLKYGYLEMLPPSHFHGPGTINTIEVTSDKRIKLHPTCDMDAQYLATLT